MVVPYDPALAQLLGLSDLQLEVAAWDPDKQQWRWLPSTCDPLSRTVSAQTTHLSLYKVVGRKARN